MLNAEEATRTLDEINKNLIGWIASWGIKWIHGHTLNIEVRLKSATITKTIGGCVIGIKFIANNLNSPGFRPTNVWWDGKELHYTSGIFDGRQTEERLGENMQRLEDIIIQLTKPKGV